MIALALALATLLLGQVNVTVEPPARSAASSEPSAPCRRRCAAVEKALARADLSRPESIEPLVAAWEALVVDGACVLPAFEPCWPEATGWDRRDPTWAAIERLLWLATPAEGIRPPDHRALRERARRALIHPCTVAAFDGELLRELGGAVLSLGWYAANDALTDGELLAAYRRRAPRAEARASSTLAPSGRITYGVRNVLDGSRSTAWCEGKPGSGVGEWIEVSVPPEAPPIDWVVVVPGYAKDFGVFRRNDRPIAIRVAACDAPHSGQVWDPRDSPDYGSPDFAVPALDALGAGTPTHCVRLTILDVERAKESDACISEIVPVVRAREPVLQITSVPGPADACPPARHD